MIRKQDMAIALFEQGERKAALKMAKGFRMGITKEESKQLTRGFECFDNPRFYQQLGFKPEEEIQKACEVFKKCFSRQN